jgi:hypothetical protein
MSSLRRVLLLAALVAVAGVGARAENYFSSKTGRLREAGTVTVVTDDSCPCQPAQTGEESFEVPKYCGITFTKAGQNTTTETHCFGPVCIPENRECCGCNFVEGEWMCFGCVEGDKCIHNKFYDTYTATETDQEKGRDISLEFYCANAAGMLLPSAGLSLLVALLSFGL